MSTIKPRNLPYNTSHIPQIKLCKQILQKQYTNYYIKQNQNHSPPKSKAKQSSHWNYKYRTYQLPTIPKPTTTSLNPNVS